MNINLNLTGKALPLHISVLYNFKEVSDLILLTLYNEKQYVLKELPLRYVDEKWVTEGSGDGLDAETLKQIDKKLRNVFCLHNQLNNSVNHQLKALLAEHALLLLNKCS